MNDAASSPMLASVLCSYVTHTHPPLRWAPAAGRHAIIFCIVKKGKNQRKTCDELWPASCPVEGGIGFNVRPHASVANIQNPVPVGSMKCVTYQSSLATRSVPCLGTRARTLNSTDCHCLSAAVTVRLERMTTLKSYFHSFRRRFSSAQKPLWYMAVA